MELEAIKACVEHGLTIRYADHGVVLRDCAHGKFYVQICGLFAPLELAPGRLNGRVTDYHPHPTGITGFIWRDARATLVCPYHSHSELHRLCCFRTPAGPDARVWVAVGGENGQKLSEEDAAELAIEYLACRFEGMSKAYDEHSWAANLLLVV